MTLPPRPVFGKQVAHGCKLVAAYALGNLTELLGICMPIFVK